MVLQAVPRLPTASVKNGGMVRLHNLKQVERADGNTVAVSRSGELAIADEFGRERERYKLPYGAVISVKEGEKVEAGAIVAKWDPHTHPIVTELKGTVTFVGMEEGITIKRQTDELTGLTNIEVMDVRIALPQVRKSVQRSRWSTLLARICTCRVPTFQPSTSCRPTPSSVWLTVHRSV